MSENVVIIIPTYNEAEVIEETIKNLEAVFADIDSAKYKMQILVCDSNSPDGTSRFVAASQQQYDNLLLINETKKTGLGGAYIYAMQYAITQLKADIVFEFDADGSHQPKYLKGMLDEFSKGADVVVGSRYIKGGSIPADWGIDRKFLSYVGNIVCRLFLTWKYKDFTSGFRGTRTSLLKKFNLNELLSKSYAYKIHLFWLLHKLNAKIIEFPIEFIDRGKGYSKFPRNNIYESLKVVFILRFCEVKKFFKSFKS